MLELDHGVREPANQEGGAGVEPTSGMTHGDGGGGGGVLGVGSPASSTVGLLKDQRAGLTTRNIHFPVVHPFHLKSSVFEHQILQRLGCRFEIAVVAKCDSEPMFSLDLVFDKINFRPFQTL